jgi:hypothetical protein
MDRIRTEGNGDLTVAESLLAQIEIERRRKAETYRTGTIRGDHD